MNDTNRPQGPEEIKRTGSTAEQSSPTPGGEAAKPADSAEKVADTSAANTGGDGWKDLKKTVDSEAINTAEYVTKTTGEVADKPAGADTVAPKAPQAATPKPTAPRSSYYDNVGEPTPPRSPVQGYTQPPVNRSYYTPQQPGYGAPNQPQQPYTPNQPVQRPVQGAPQQGQYGQPVQQNPAQPYGQQPYRPAQQPGIPNTQQPVARQQVNPQQVPPATGAPPVGTPVTPPTGTQAKPYAFDASRYTGQIPKVQMEDKKEGAESSDLLHTIDESATGDGNGGSDKPKKKKRRGVVAFVAIICTVLVLSGGLIGAYFLLGGNDGDVDPDQGSSSGSMTLNDRPEDNEPAPQAGELLTSTQVATKVKPSVVGIASYDRSNSIEPSGYGSGIIMSEDGYIITNNHVIEDATAYTVTLNSGEQYAATLVGGDAKTDLAVLKIDAKGLTPAEFGNSDQIEVGEQVLAIGNPGGPTLAGSVTQGIVSAVNRNIASSTSTYEMNLIQTDAAINPGNSGGALVNLYGQVVGINTMKIVQEGYEGLGFAIPMNDAKPVLESLMENGYVKDRVWLGVTVIEITESLAKINDLPQGLYINEIVSGGSIDGSGVQVGDVLIAINGDEVLTYQEMQNILRSKSPGDEVKMTFYRKSATGTDKNFDVTIKLVEDKSQS